jgi:hypothetical protein
VDIQHGLAKGGRTTSRGIGDELTLPKQESFDRLNENRQVEGNVAAKKKLLA